MSRKMSKFIQEARTLIENAASTQEIAKALAVYGYSEARFKEGLDLLERTEKTMMKKSMEHGEKIEATADFVKAWRAANVMYVKTLKIARIALEDDARCDAGLLLSGARKQTFSGWSFQANTFYHNLLSRKVLVARMGVYGYSPESLAKERDVVDRTAKTYQRHAVQSGEAQVSTQEKDAMLEELDAWVSALRAVCEIALYDDREQLEKLGPLAPIRRSRQPRKPVAEPAIQPVAEPALTV
ncbi:MAG: hypothetical protein CVV47_15655 [Spirochaetae bacterium HGW-Spirochaetae-3]|jgi:hypothetical protein|nr:MAG: hypothetical protein CVV47_15655 [Spirochaetae bacterium HGW-Spirochaetae-3]